MVVGGGSFVSFPSVLVDFVLFDFSFHSLSLQQATISRFSLTEKDVKSFQGGVPQPFRVR